MRSVVAVDKRRTLAARGVAAGAVGTYPTGGEGGTLGSGHSTVVSQDGSVMVNGAVTPPGAAGGEGIAAS